MTQRSMNNGKNKKKRSKITIFKVIKSFFLLLIATGFIVVLIGIGFAVAAVKTAPKLDIGYITQLNEPSKILDDTGQVIDYAGSSNRKVISISDAPQYLKDAFTSIEDERFYSHHGLDFKRLIGASLASVKSKLTGQGAMQGGSTLTQQLIKQRMFLESSLTDRLNFERKFQEMYLAWDLEKNLSKDEILEAYMNAVSCGGPANGVGAATKLYFNKDNINQLTLLESAFIAGTVQAPSIYYPFYDANIANPSVYVSRTKLVLKQMLKNKKISQGDYDAAVAEIATHGENIPFTRGTIAYASNLDYGFFTIPMLKQVKEDLKAKYSYSDKDVEDLVNGGGLTIYSTMNKPAQDTAQGIINEDSSFRSLESGVDANGLIQPQSSAVFIDNETNQVKVMIGGRKVAPSQTYNRAADFETFKKQVGSSIKPLTVYAPAIEQKKITLASIGEDTPIDEATLKRMDYGSVIPKNAAGNYLGSISIRTAVAASSNIVALRTLDLIGVDTAFDYATKLHIGVIDADKAYSTLALGGLTEGTNTLNMAAAYNVFANNGNYTRPLYYSKVTDSNGVTILEAQKITERVFSPETAYLTYLLLKEPVNNPIFATGSFARLTNGMPTAGKTGSTENYMNLWFAGLTPYYSGAVWVGNDTMTEIPGFSSSNAVGNAWRLIMEYLVKDKEIKDLTAPSGLVQTEICKKTGLLANDLCKAAGDSYNEYFIPGTQPTAYTNAHVKVEPKKDATPAKNNTQTPAQTPTQKPAQTQPQTPTQKPAQTQTQTPSQTQAPSNNTGSNTNSEDANAGNTPPTKPPTTQ